MSHPTRSVVIFGIALAMATAGLTAQNGRPRAGLEVYDDVGYGGKSVLFVRDTPDLRASGFADRISSLRVAPGESWQICDGRDYGGRCEVVTGDRADLRQGGWSDRISSVRQLRGGRESYLPDIAPRTLQLFAGTNYSGQRMQIGGPVADLRRANFNDRALSARVPRGESWEICVNANYDDCRVIDGDVPDLGRVGINRLVSSVRPHLVGGRGDGFPRGGGFPRQLPHLVMYDAAGFRGRSVSVDGSAPNLSFFNDRAGSIEVFGGTWQICDRGNFGGRCVTIDQSVRDLRTLGLGDRVSSVRLR